MTPTPADPAPTPPVVDVPRLTDPPEEVRALTVRQPWASLIACGAKTIWTSPRPTDYRGPLLVHAGKTKPSTNEEALLRCNHHYCNPEGPSMGEDLPLGAVVAVATLADVVPIGRDAEGPYVAECEHEGDLPHQQGGLWLIGPTQSTHGRPTRIEHERPLGDFTPGRYAWLLTDVQPLSDPVPAKGRQGLWEPDPGLVEACTR